MNEVEPITHCLALGVIILVSAIFATLAFGMACCKTNIKDLDEWDWEPEQGDIDTANYFNKEDDEEHI